MRVLLLMTLILGAALVSGCVAPYRAVPLATGDLAHNKPFQQSREGLVLAATLVDDDDRARELFFHALPSENVVPVVLHIENEGENTMTFRLENVRLVLEDGAEIPAADTSEIIRDAQQSLTTAYLGLPLVVPYFLTKREVDEFNFELTRDYREKALPEFLRYTAQDPPSSRVLFFRVEDSQFAAMGRSPVLQVPVDFESHRSAGGVTPGKREYFHLALD